MESSAILDIPAARGETRGVSVEEAREKRGAREGDEALMRRVAAGGDDGALSALYDRYAGMVYAMGLRLSGDRSLAEDLVQDVFASVWGKAESFDPSKASLVTWIYRIARNRSTDLDRRRRSRPASAGSEPLVHVVGSEDTRRLAERLDVAEALSRLSPDHQEVLALAYLEGLTQREIALTLGVPLGTVKSRTASALKAMRRTMLPGGEADG
ncbi:MAG: sigma-70 family RNA polymerase sigma factor [Actinomycetota bacterium]|nr:sigma-70 family RNA polymerase sigma factor [Actinomycetota bacterium]MDP9485574.1 sigma-70 family RNA polymerase sigma factor [Actinomycetota bacterium]